MDRAETIFDTISLKCKIVLKFIMEFEFLSNLDLTYLCMYICVAKIKQWKGKVQ